MISFTDKFHVILSKRMFWTRYSEIGLKHLFLSIRFSRSKWFSKVMVITGFIDDYLNRIFIEFWSNVLSLIWGSKSFKVIRMMERSKFMKNHWQGPSDEQRWHRILWFEIPIWTYFSRLVMTIRATDKNILFTHSELLTMFHSPYGCDRRLLPTWRVQSDIWRLQKRPFSQK